MKSPTLFKLITGFFTKHLSDEMNVTENTSKAYRDGLKLLLKFISKIENCSVSNLQISNLNSEYILKFLEYLENERDNSIRTRNARLAMIHTFFRYVIMEDPLSANLCERVLRIPQKKEYHSTLKYLSGQETKKVLDSVNRSTIKGRRDYLLLVLIYDIGARVQEVLNLRPCDFRFEIPVHVKISGKGRKERLCPLLPQTICLVKCFLEEHGRLSTDTNPLFQNKLGLKITRHGVRYILKKYVRVAGKDMPNLLRQNISPHTLRHSKAVHLLQAGVPLVTIKDILGHADVKTTSIYAETDLESKRTALMQGEILTHGNAKLKISNDVLQWLERL